MTQETIPTPAPSAGWTSPGELIRYYSTWIATALMGAAEYLTLMRMAARAKRQGAPA